jgi:hypothetical protein
MDIIEQLKNNEKPFGLMSKEMQAKAKEIGACEFNFFVGQHSGNWDTLNKDDMLRWYRTYRLRPDYKEEPEMAKCKVILDSGGYLCCAFEGFDEDACQRLSECQDNPDFIGFLYEDGSVYATARKGENGSVNMSDVKVLTPTHVLFSKGK